MLSSVLLLVVLTSPMTRSLSTDAVTLPGDVMIGGLLSVYDSSCRDVKSASVELVEAVRWMTSQLNERNFIPNVTIGLHLLPTCGQRERATEQALKLLSDYPQGSAPPLLGILGPAYSSETAYVTRVLASLTSQVRPPLVSISATATGIAAAAKEAGNFLRVIPPDSVQVEVMEKLLATLQWNYVALVFESSLYGKEGAADLKARLERSGAACVAVYESIPASYTDRELENLISQILEKVKVAQVSGMVLFTTGDATRDILRSMENAGLRYVEFIISEAISLRASRLKTTAGQILPAARGALVTSPPLLRNQAFYRHWQIILANQTKRDLLSRDNPWLKGLDPAAVEDQDESLFSTYAMTGALALAEAARQLHMRKCQGAAGMCQALRNVSREEMVQELHSIRLNLSEATSDPSNTGALTFDPEGEAVAVEPGSKPQYQVFSFQDSSGGFDFVKVGDFRAGQLVLNKSAVRVYPESGAWLPLPQAAPAQCRAGRDCVQCLPADLPDAVLLVPGDYYVVVVAPIHDNDPGNPLLCGSIRTAISVDLAEAAVFAVNKINQRQGIFQGLLEGRLGLAVVNSCNAPLVIERKLLALHAGTLSLGGGRNSSEILSKLIGYVGGLGSGVSISMARILTELGKVQISYASTSDQLSDRNTYKYFMRLSSPNSEEMDAMLDIIVRTGSNYVQIVYSDEPYGRGGKDALVAKAAGRGVCVASAIAITETTESHNKVKDELLKNPFAKLVILFVRSHLVQPVMLRMAASGSLGSFYWLASETWGRRSALLDIPGVAGTITVVQPATPLTELENHLRSQNLASTSDPWLQAFWEARLNCYLPGSFRRKSNQPCPQDLSNVSPGEYLQDAWAPYLVYSVYSLVLGWHTAVRQRCGARVEARACPELGPQDLYSAVRDVRLDLRLQGQQLKVFSHNGDGTGGFDVLQVVRKDGALIYDSVGTWTVEDGLVTSLGHAQWNSTCPNAQECARCSPQTPSDACPQLRPDIAPVAALGALLAAFILAFIVTLACLVYMARRGGKGFYDYPASVNGAHSSAPAPPPRPASHQNVISGAVAERRTTYNNPNFVNAEDSTASQPASPPAHHATVSGVEFTLGSDWSTAASSENSVSSQPSVPQPSPAQPSVAKPYVPPSPLPQPSPPQPHLSGSSNSGRAGYLSAVHEWPGEKGGEADTNGNLDHVTVPSDLQTPAPVTSDPTNGSAQSSARISIV